MLFFLIPSQASLCPTDLFYFPTKPGPQHALICCWVTKCINLKWYFKQYSSLKLTSCYYLHVKGIQNKSSRRCWFLGCSVLKSAQCAEQNRQTYPKGGEGDRCFRAAALAQPCEKLTGALAKLSLWDTKEMCPKVVLEFKQCHSPALPFQRSQCWIPPFGIPESMKGIATQGRSTKAQSSNPGSIIHMCKFRFLLRTTILY